MRDEEFICENCLSKVKPLEYTARNHCPNCLFSKHVDNNPGDRDSNCLGLLKPISVEKSKKSDFKIIFECQKCKSIRKNIMAKDDNIDLIIKISANFY